MQANSPAVEGRVAENGTCCDAMRIRLGFKRGITTRDEDSKQVLMSYKKDDGVCQQLLSWNALMGVKNNRFGIF